MKGHMTHKQGTEIFKYEEVQHCPVSWVGNMASMKWLLLSFPPTELPPLFCSGLTFANEQRSTLVSRPCGEPHSAFFCMLLSPLDASMVYLISMIRQGWSADDYEVGDKGKGEAAVFDQISDKADKFN